MTEYLKYKGYHGTIEPQLEDNMLFGKIAFINDLVTYEAKDLVQLKKEFQTSVDDYLAFCAERGKQPNKPFKGSFNVRTGARPSCIGLIC
jgi:predicted HicB family RNase H-like nuclease